MSKTIRVSIKGERELRAALQRVTKAAPELAKREIVWWALQVETAAKQRSPVDTGRLRSSIRPEYRDKGLTGEVFSDVEYAPFVELGTTRQQAQPFLLPAFEEVRPQLLARLKNREGDL